MMESFSEASPAPAEGRLVPLSFPEAVQVARGM
jgi:hypothetical protein